MRLLPLMAASDRRTWIAVSQYFASRLPTSPSNCR
jgi:hypothetical protein